MADVRAKNGESGFTLIEMMVAMAILVGGLTSIIALLTVGVSTRYAAESRQQAVWLADRVFQELGEEAFGNPWLDPDAPIAIPSAETRTIPEVPGMTYTVHFTTNEEQLDLILVELRVRWSEQGETEVQSFRRVFRRKDPFPVRARRVLEERGGGVAR